MKLVILGSGGFVHTEEAQTACYFLPEYGILLDAGTGLPFRLSRYLQTTSLDVFLSHTHGDHTVGLTYIWASFFRRLLAESTAPVDESVINNISQRANELMNRARIHVTAEMLPVLKSHFFGLDFDWRILAGSESLPDGGTLTHFVLKPGREEIGFRLDWPGHSLAYVTDTTASEEAAYIDKIAGVDLLLHDCDLPDDKSNIAAAISHSNTSAAAQVAARAGVKHLILIHKNPLGWPIEADLPAARRIFPAIEIGYDGMEIDF
jgi:ribonuclease Z